MVHKSKTKVITQEQMLSKLSLWLYVNFISRGIQGEGKKCQPMISGSLSLIFTSSSPPFPHRQCCSHTELCLTHSALCLQTLGLKCDDIWSYKKLAATKWAHSLSTPMSFCWHQGEEGKDWIVMLGLTANWSILKAHIHPWSWSASPRAIWGRESCPVPRCSLPKPEAPPETSHCRSSGGGGFWFYGGELWNEVLLN